MSEPAEQIKITFEEFKRGLHGLQADAARGDLKAVEDGLNECLAVVNELERAVLLLLDRDER
jgi:hypothetical protein